MGSSISFVLYLENEKRNRDDVCDEISLDLPKRFKKSKLIYEPIYNKYGFHECILTLEYNKTKDSIEEYKDEIVIKKKLIENGKKAYIKIANNGGCICQKIRKDQNFNNGNEKNSIISEKETPNQNNMNDNIEEIKSNLENERRKREELERELKEEREKNIMKNEEMYYNLKEEKENNKKHKEYNERLVKEFNFKIEKLEKDVKQIKNKNNVNPNEIKNQNFDTFIKEDDDSFHIFMNDIDEKKKEFLLDQSKEFENSIVLYENEVINPTIKALMENTYTKFLNNLRYKDFQDNIFNFLDFKTMYFSIKNKIEENIKTICKNITKTKHFNIVLLGREGVGKSTLVNIILKLDKENEAKTGVGDSVTLEIKKYSNPKMDFLRIYDTQGIGIKEDNSIEKIFSNISKLINEQIIKEDANPDDLIHCLWFCFNGRLGDLENDILQKLSETYSDKTLPFIIVHTKTLNKAEAKQSIKSIMEKYDIP